MGIFSSITTLRFALGGLTNWKEMWELHPATWSLLMTLCFVVLLMVLNNLAISIMLSFKKEKDLFEHYSYHFFWASERGQVTDPKEFNPAGVGWDFSGKEPKEIKLDKDTYKEFQDKKKELAESEKKKGG